MEKNGRWVTKFLVGALWTVVIGAIVTIGNNLISSDKDSRVRDSAEACQRELIKNDVVRIDTNQKAVMTQLDKVVSNQDKLLTLIPVVARLEKKIDEIK